MIQDGSDLWLNLKNSDVWVNWPLSPVQGLLKKSGLLDNRPLLELLKNIGSGFSQFYKKVTVSALDIQTGKVKVFD